MPHLLVHAVTITKQGQSKSTMFRRRYDLPVQPQNGLRVSLGEVASFVMEDLTFHLDTKTFTCRTSIEVSPDRPLDDVLAYYRQIGYELVG